MVSIDLSEIKLINTYIKDMESTEDFRAIPITFNGEAINPADYFAPNWHFHEKHFYNAVDLLDRIERRKAEQIKAALDPPEMEWFFNENTRQVEQRPRVDARWQGDIRVAPGVVAQGHRFNAPVQGGGGGFFAPPGWVQEFLPAGGEVNNVIHHAVVQDMLWVDEVREGQA